MSTYISHNVYRGQSLASLRRNLPRLTRRRGRNGPRPLAVALQEAWHWRGTLPGYRTCVARDAGLTRDDTYRHNQLLVRDDKQVLRVVPLKVPNGDWIFDGHHKEPRVWLRVVIRTGPREIEEVWVIHRLPLGPVPPRDSNKPVWNREHDFLVERVRAVRKVFPNRKITLLGDWNTSKGKNPGHPASIESLAKALDARIHMVHIDGALQINGPRRVTTKRLASKYGSDAHRPVVIKEET